MNYELSFFNSWISRFVIQKNSKLGLISKWASNRIFYIILLYKQYNFVNLIKKF
jgi:hypothetical protein